MNNKIIRTGSLNKDEEAPQIPFHINNISIKPLQLENYHQQTTLKQKKLKFTLNNRLAYQSQAESRNSNAKMLPGISIKNISADDKKITEFKHRFKGLPVRRPLRNSRNSEILNSIIDILKTDPDKSFRTKNATQIKTQPSHSNQFLEMREISSVKNSRGPKILGNDMIMFGTHQLNKRNLQSQEKTRQKRFGEYSHSLSKKDNGRKIDPFDEMEMTFYKPARRINTNIPVGENLQKNQFMFQ